MLGRGVPYTTIVCTRTLVVIVGQKKALFLAVRDWRRSPGHTALGGLLEGTLRFTWSPTMVTAGESDGPVPVVWEGSGADAP
jgi:hypothetical protein